jgi:hypothetical protein
MKMGIHLLLVVDATPSSDGMVRALARLDCYLISFVSGGRYAENLGWGGRGESREVSG